MTAECCQPSPSPERRLDATTLPIGARLGPTGSQCAESINGGGSLPTVADPIPAPAMVRLSRTTYHRVKSCVGFVNCAATCRQAGLSGCLWTHDSITALPRKSAPYGPQRTVQFLACTSPHPRNYAAAGGGRPLAEAREAAAGWLVALLARGCAGRRRRGTPQRARSARSVVCPRSAPNHRTARP
jgi:hypothetical protein